MKTSRLFIAITAALAIGGFLLAAGNSNPGAYDSRENLALARTLSEGKGFVSNAIGQLLIHEDFPHPERFRPIGLPLALSAGFRIFGTNLAVPVLLNVLTILATGLCLHLALLRATPGPAAVWFPMMFLFSKNYHLLDAWNNNSLTLCTTLLLLIYSRKEEHPPLSNAAASGAVAACGFLLKPTFVVTALPFCALLLLTDERIPNRLERIKFLAMFGGLLALMTSWQWGPELLHHGRLTDSLTPRLRLNCRYLEAGDCISQLRWGKGWSYAEVADRIGLSGIARAEWRMYASTISGILLLNPIISAVAVVAAFLAHWRRVQIPFLLLLACSAEPFFSSAVYFHYEWRYILPTFPPLLYFTASAVSADLERGPDFPKATARLRAATLLALIAGALPGLRYWRGAFIDSRVPPPTWTERVHQLTNGDSVIMTDSPPSVSWYLGRKSVLIPRGPREDVLKVARHYGVTNFLSIWQSDPTGFGFKNEELTRLDGSPPGEASGGWALYKVELPAAMAPVPAAAASR